MRQLLLETTDTMNMNSMRIMRAAGGRTFPAVSPLLTLPMEAPAQALWSFQYEKPLPAGMSRPPAWSRLLHDRGWSTGDTESDGKVAGLFHSPQFAEEFTAELTSVHGLEILLSDSPELIDSVAAARPDLFLPIGRMPSSLRELRRTFADLRARMAAGGWKASATHGLYGSVLDRSRVPPQVYKREWVACLRDWQHDNDQETSPYRHALAALWHIGCTSHNLRPVLAEQFAAYGTVTLRTTEYLPRSDIVARAHAIFERFGEGRGFTGVFREIATGYSGPWILSNGGGNEDEFRLFVTGTPQESRFPFTITPVPNLHDDTAVYYAHMRRAPGLQIFLSADDLLTLYETDQWMDPYASNFVAIREGQIGKFRMWMRARQLPLRVFGTLAALDPWFLRAAQHGNCAVQILSGQDTICSLRQDCEECTRWAHELNATIYIK